MVCRQTQSGAEATFTLSMKQEYRAIQPSYQFSDFTVELFDSMDDVDLSLSGKHYADFQVIDKWAEEAGIDSQAIQTCDNAEEALALILPILEPGDAVLAKASHSIGLDRIVKELVS